MADHFDRLLARGVPGYPTTDPVALPRLPQLFEPVEAGLEIETEVWSTPATPAGRPEPGSSGPAGPRGPAGDTPRVPPPVAPEVAPSPARPAPEPVRVESSETLVTTEHTRHEVSGEPVVEHRLTTVDVRVRPPAPVAELRPQHTTVVAPPPKVEPRRVPAPPPQPTPAPRQQPVHVSIGRVEVTATAPERTRPPRAVVSRPEPVLSLERYLAREEDRR